MFRRRWQTRNQTLSPRWSGCSVLCKEGLLKILGPSTTGAVTQDDIARMATSMATASSAAMDEVIGADGKVIEDPTMEDYVTYYTGMLQGIYGGGGGGQTSGNTRVFNENSGKVE